MATAGGGVLLRELGHLSVSSPSLLAQRITISHEFLPSSRHVCASTNRGQCSWRARAAVSVQEASTETISEGISKEFRLENSGHEDANSHSSSYGVVDQPPDDDAPVRDKSMASYVETISALQEQRGNSGPGGRRLAAVLRSRRSPAIRWWLHPGVMVQETVVDLLVVLGRRASLPVAICCSARDSLDAVCATVSASKQFSLLFLHSDQGDAERAEALSHFHAIVGDWNHSACKSSVPKAEVDNGEEQAEPKKSGLLVTTDACLPAAALGEPSFGARVLIHYDLPTKKESYLRRMAACLASAPTVAGTTSIGGIAGGIVISVVVGGEVGLLRSIEEGCGVVIDEMPILASVAILVFVRFATAFRLFLRLPLQPCLVL